MVRRKRPRRGERAQIYVRKSNFVRGGYVIIDGDQEREGTEEDVSSKFFVWHKYLKAKELRAEAVQQSVEQSSI